MTTNGFVRRLVAALLFVAGCAALTALGLWQLERADVKRERFETFEARLEAPPVDVDNLDPAEVPGDYLWRRAELHGHYRDRHVLLDNRVQHGRAGYEVLTPFRTAGGRTVLVDRGWIPLPERREVVPDVLAPADPFTIHGFLGGPPVVGIDVSGDADTAEWMSPTVLRVQRVDLDALAPLLAFEPWPAVVYLDADAPGALSVAWAPPGDGSARHIAYAVQWFAMAAVLALIGVWRWRRARGRS